MVPSWQTTTVPESWGTTTVVFFSGGGGLLLLMQPDSRQAATQKLDNTFMHILLVSVAPALRSMGKVSRGMRRPGSRGRAQRSVRCVLQDTCP